MKLIGMLDSPYVRRVAISARLMGLPLEHEAVSVFRHIDRFREINPLIKAPTLICDDGGILMDSTLILDHLESLAAPERRLTPTAAPARQHTLYRLGVALAAMEKAVQWYYEIVLRPEDKRWDDWIARISGQLRDAFGLLESALPEGGDWFGSHTPDSADVASAVAWRFAGFVLPGKIDEAHYPRLLAHSARAEAHPAFITFPLD
ncbi:glutathione S-transferase family protein [Niveibacterium sp. 24ML]|uniref:glutathione S-transferase family protein n=1 Tax=Niveibacterium sp. 24ML TaxID=2985512 RepID=UPI00226F2437|nr:glutathione S-transferase family protein [Niveibacterium sp. 24ML]MCX9154729.1 glutathione S-transferase family protein [Niveibacterium sp. 24ML]